jgi:hypothetical protein
MFPNTNGRHAVLPYNEEAKRPRVGFVSACEVNGVSDATPGLNARPIAERQAYS